MILNISKIKTEAILLFCRDILDMYQEDENIFNINDDTKYYIINETTNLYNEITKVVKPIDYYINNQQNIRIKMIIKSYEYINKTISKHFQNQAKFNPSMLCFSFLATWFKELEYETNSKEYIYFLLYPYSNIVDKLIVQIDNLQYKQLNISMIEIAEDIIFKLHNFKIN